MAPHYFIDPQETAIARHAAMHQQRRGGKRLHANAPEYKNSKKKKKKKKALQMFHEEQDAL